MNAYAVCGRGAGSVISALLAAGVLSTTAIAEPSFLSTDPRLPNPDRPYVMESGNFGFPDLFVSGLTLWATDPAQLDTPSMTVDGGWKFDSTYDVAFSAFAGVGTAPPVPVTGTGTARAVGVAGPDTAIFDPRVYETEMLQLDLQGQVFSQPFIIRESPTLASRGVTTTLDICPQCDGPFTTYRITSFFDVFTELSFDGGQTWTPSLQSVHIEQTPEPASGRLILCGMGFVVLLGRQSRGSRLL